MARIISTLFISLDGVAEIDPDWHFPYFDDEMGAAVGEDYDGADALLLGRVTYDSFAGAWPEREAAGGDDAAFAAQLGDTLKIVATHSERALGWRNVESVDDVVAAAHSLREDESVGTVVVPGSISVVRQLLAAGLVDELRLFVHPVAARHGQRLFDEGDGLYRMRLVRTQSFPKGVVKLSYAFGEGG